MLAALECFPTDYLDVEFEDGEGDLPSLGLDYAVSAETVWTTAEHWVPKNKSLIIRIVSPYRRYLPAGTNCEDLKSIALLAAYDAINQAIAKERIEDFVPFFCTIFKKEILKISAGISCVGLDENNIHSEVDSAFSDHDFDEVRFDSEPQSFQEEENQKHETRCTHVIESLSSKQQRIANAVLDNPSLSLQEIADNFSVSAQAVYQLFDRTILAIKKGQCQNPHQEEPQKIVSETQKNIVFFPQIDCVLWEDSDNFSPAKIVRSLTKKIILKRPKKAPAFLGLHRRFPFTKSAPQKRLVQYNNRDKIP